MLAQLPLERSAHAAGSDTIRIGLIGCGGRGTEATVNAMNLGTKGRCNLLAYRIEGETKWQYDRPRENMYDLGHRALFDTIRSARPINNGPYMCLSSALAVAAQIACYTGAILTWEDVLRSRRTFTVPRYGWDVELPVKPGPDGRYPTARQGSAEYDRWLM